MKTHGWPLVGQNQAIEYLEHLLAFERQQPGSLGGCYIFSGAASLGKTTVLGHFLSRLSGGEAIDLQDASGADIVRLELAEERRGIGVAQAREFSGRLSLSSFAGRYRVGIIFDAETLSLEAANALLKTLEDAREQVLIFLLASAPDRLPATIVSRSQRIPFAPVPADDLYEWLIAEKGMSRPQAKNLSRLANGRPGLALRLAADKQLLEEYLAPVRLLCSAFRLSLAERWQAVGKLLGSAKGAENAAQAGRILAAWRLALRDLLLMRLNRPELVTHAFLEQELREAGKQLTLGELRRYDYRLEEASSYLAANVSPKLVLEQALMNLV